MDGTPHKSGDARPEGFVEALAKGLAVLETFGTTTSDMTLSEVARAVGVSPAAARRSLITLMELGYVGQTQKRFHLTPKVMSLGSAVYFSARIDELLQPDLQALVATHGDASSVAVLDGADVIYIAHYTVQRARRAAAVVGARYPALATSLGRVLLAGLPELELDRYLGSVTPVALTSKTCTDIADLRQEICRVREMAYATTVDQLDYGITALAVPIRGPDGGTVAALNSSGYTGMVTPDQLVAERLPDLRAAASRITTTLARYPMLASVVRSRGP